MKRYIRSWSTAEPSADEYGKMMQSYAQRLATRYEPFIVKSTYFNKWSANSDGYRITLYSNPDSFEPMDAEFAPEAEWIAQKGGSTFSPKLSLYGPFDPGEVRDAYHPGLGISNGKLIKEFDSDKLDTVMDYLFRTVDLDEYGYDD